ncbi:NosD domain-containing protein [Desulforamulus ruminis]|uniref:Periplasmic copper-binding protein n=1 Tax=Desulforamulus ruminis (strain ATCC 23193 / DSM 2154 / NCIMB 8452 / DL) TaxID=696281 RepID=F6DRN4_DESRL|nr:NosD domain-containing protein [Desulforamulus ruminis]AEG59795.1 periplasmic copper-binding protein [Desulforamulus ruminis DSM 2154]
MGRKILLCFFTILLLTLGRAGPVAAVTVEVKPGEPVGTLQQVLEEAKDGDTIQVHPGHYRGGLVIKKAVSLIGVDHPVLNGNGNGDVLTVLANGVTIKGFTITGSGKQLEQADAGIKLKSVQRVTIEGCRLVNNLFGLYLDRATDNIITHNEIKGRQKKAAAQEDETEEPLAGLHAGFAGETGDGIHLFAASGNKINHNVITQTRDGIYFNYAQGNRLIGNKISFVRYGIHYMYSDENYFEQNLLTDNVAGAALMFSKGIVLKNNVFAHSRGHRAYGILFATCDHSVAQGNLMVDNTRGLFFDTSLHNVFRGNLLDRNDVALDLISSSSDNLFVENNFMDNLQQVAMITGRVGDGNRFYAQGKGNYWHDYRGFDLDRDGIGDIPHKTGDPFTYLMAKSPAVRLFLNSPAATALEFSERMFPVIDIPKVEDRYPLSKPARMEPLDFAYQKKPIGNHWLGWCSLLMFLIALAIFSWAFGLHRRYWYWISRSE